MVKIFPGSGVHPCYPSVPSRTNLPQRWACYTDTLTKFKYFVNVRAFKLDVKYVTKKPGIKRFTKIWNHCSSFFFLRKGFTQTCKTFISFRWFIPKIHKKQFVHLELFYHFQRCFAHLFCWKCFSISLHLPALAGSRVPKSSPPWPSRAIFVPVP